MIAGVKLLFVAFEEDWLDTTWEWLADEEIKALTMAPKTTREEQHEWFMSLAGRRDYLIWGVQADSRKVGVVGLKNIEHEQGEYWGYIGEKDLWGQGIGKQMQQFVVSVATKQGLKSLYLMVDKGNVRALNSYKRFGFSICSNFINDRRIRMTLKL